MTNNCSIAPLSEYAQETMKIKGVWKDNCPINLDRLRVVNFSYYDFNNSEHYDGKIVVLDVVAKRVRNIFNELHALKFPIPKADVIEEYDGDDEKSLADNNSCGFNCRQITQGGSYSIHSYGLAIDINPIQNPYILHQDSSNNQPRTIKILPNAGGDYLNRTNIRPGMVEPIVNVFAKNGFNIWGGKWNNPIDWHHFQPAKAIAQLLAEMNYTDGYILFELYVKEPTLLNSIDSKDNSLLIFYHKNPNLFMACFKNIPNLLKMAPDKAYSILSEKISCRL